MSESKILLALRAYKEQYAWDKSLVIPRDTLRTTPAPPDGKREEHSNTSLEDFANGIRTR